MADERSWRRAEPNDPGDETAGIRRRFEALLPAVLKRTMSTGVEAAHATEDVIRGMVGELKLPREVVTYIVDVADNTRREVVRVAAREFREFLESANLTEEAVRLLTSVSFEVKTEIRFIPNDQRLRPNVKSQVRVRGEATDEPAEPDVDPTPGFVRDSGVVEAFDELLRAGATDIADRLLRRSRGERKSPEAGDEVTAASETANNQASSKEKPQQRRRTTKKKA